MNAHAIRMTQTGGPEVLEYVEIDLPEPGPGQAAVAVHAAGVNFIDTYHRSGLYEVPLPFTPGSEGAGTVTAVGPDVTAVSVGDRVAWVGVPGSYATHVIADAGTLMVVPDDISLDTAAATPLQAMTAHYLITDTYPLGPGDRCLVHAAAGGTGRLIVQMAKLRGAEVVATAGSDEKLEIARSGGADHTINYREVDIVEGVEAAVGKDAIDAVFDGVGAATFDAGLAVLRHRGVMATFGNASGCRATGEPTGADAEVAVPRPAQPVQPHAHGRGATRPLERDHRMDPAGRARDPDRPHLARRRGRCGARGARVPGHDGQAPVDRGMMTR